MARSISRIDKFLELLGNKWKESPDMRFTQLLYNLDIDPEGDYNQEDYETVQQFASESHTILRDFIEWGSYGKDGKGPLRYILVKDLEDDHINAILESQHHISEKMRVLLLAELAYRKEMK